MVFKNDHKYKYGLKLIAFLVCFSVIFQTSLILIPRQAQANATSMLPAFKAAKTTKLLVAKAKPTVPTSDPNENARSFLDGLAITIAQLFVKEIIDDTIRWANTGFEGGPAYAINPKSYFTQLADNVLGEQLSRNSDLQFLCSPFRDAVRISLALDYYSPPRSYYNCPISSVAGNIEDFYQDFSEGGWQSWFEMTQNPSGNPFDAYLTAKGEIASRINNELETKQRELDWNQGFLSWSECIKKDPNTGECLKRGDTKTPGSVIKSNLDSVLPTELEQLVSVDQFDQLLGAILGGLLQKFVFGNDGLFRSDHRTNFPDDLSDLPFDYEDYDSDESSGDEFTDNGDPDSFDNEDSPPTPGTPGAGEGDNMEITN